MFPDIQERLDRNRDLLDRLCKKVAAKRLFVFGSAVRGDFQPSASDLDFLVEFHNAAAPGISDRFLELAEGLERLFGRPIDLLTDRSLRNPIFRDSVNSTAEAVYED